MYKIIIDEIVQKENYQRKSAKKIISYLCGYLFSERVFKHLDTTCESIRNTCYAKVYEKETIKTLWNQFNVNKLAPTKLMFLYTHIVRK